MKKTTPPSNLTELLRTRCDKNLKRRVRRLAKHRHCAEADVLREAISRQLDEEEQRLGIATLKAA